MRRTINTDFLGGFLLFILGLFIWLHSKSFPSLPEGHPGPALFPGILGVGLALSGITLLGINARRIFSSEKVVVSLPAFLRLAVSLIAVGVFPFVASLIGFVLSIGVLCFVMGLLLQVTWWKSILTAGGAAGAIHLVFSNLLGVPL